jgi:hypothetical protein
MAFKDQIIVDLILPVSCLCTLLFFISYEIPPKLGVHRFFFLTSKKYMQRESQKNSQKFDLNYDLGYIMILKIEQQKKKRFNQLIGVM